MLKQFTLLLLVLCVVFGKHTVQKQVFAQVQNKHEDWTAEDIEALLDDEDLFEEALDEALQHVDVDGDNEVSFEEFSDAANHHQAEHGLPPFTEEELQDIFDAYDVDGSGSFDVDEFADAFRAFLEEELAHMDDHPDGPPVLLKKGKWTLSEVEEILEDEDAFEEVFEAIYAETDFDEDGLISFEEFQASIDAEMAEEGLEPLSDGEAKAIFDAYDVDGNGTIDEDEFHDALRDYFEYQAYILGGDVDGPPVLLKKKAKKASETEASADEDSDAASDDEGSDAASDDEGSDVASDDEGSDEGSDEESVVELLQKASETEGSDAASDDEGSDVASDDEGSDVASDDEGSDAASDDEGSDVEGSEETE